MRPRFVASLFTWDYDMDIFPYQWTFFQGMAFNGYFVAIRCIVISLISCYLTLYCFQLFYCDKDITINSCNTIFAQSSDNFFE